MDRSLPSYSPLPSHYQPILPTQAPKFPQFIPDCIPHPLQHPLIPLSLFLSPSNPKNSHWQNYPFPPSQHYLFHYNHRKYITINTTILKVSYYTLVIILCFENNMECSIATNLWNRVLTLAVSFVGLVVCFLVTLISFSYLVTLSISTSVIFIFIGELKGELDLKVVRVLVLPIFSYTYPRQTQSTIF